MSEANKVRRFQGRFWVLFALVIMAIGVAFGAGWWRLSQEKARDDAMNQETAMKVLGLNKVIEHVLNPRYPDADGDLLADTPTDPAKQIDPATLTFCYIGGEAGDKYPTIWKDFIDHLSKTTGKPVEYVVFKSLNDEIKAIRDGKLFIAGLNTGSVPIAVNEAGFIPAVIIGATDRGTYCELIVPSDSTITKPEDFKGKTLEFVEPNSNTGYKVPVAILRQNFNMLPQRDYEYNLSYDHVVSIVGIASKKFDGAAVASDMLDRAIKKDHVLTEADFRVVYKSERFPPAALGYAYNLTPALQEKVREAFKTYAWPEGPLKQEFAPAGQDRFTPTNYKADWSLVRVIDNSTGKAYNIK